MTYQNYSSAQIYETLSQMNGQVNHNTLAFIRRANLALDKWWAECDELHSNAGRLLIWARLLTSIIRQIYGRG